MRATVEKLVKDRPQPGADEVQKARTLLQPLLDIRVAERAQALGFTGKHQTVDFITASVMCVYLLLTAILSLLCAAAFRGGLMMRMLGIAVVKNDGRDASRLHMLWRSLIAWTPILLAPLGITCLTRFMQKAGAQDLMQGIGLSTMVVLFIALAIAVIATRGRGLHDRLARTWLVPR